MAYRFGYYKYRVRYNRYSRGPVRYLGANKVQRGRFVRALVPTKRRTTYYRKRYGPKGKRMYRR